MGSYKCYFTISFSAPLMLILHAVIAENSNESRASKTCISKINVRLLIVPIKVLYYKTVKLKEEIIFEIVRF